MHMADALLSPGVGAAMYGVSGLSLAYASRKMKTRFSDRALPLMAVSGAFVFSAQMINFTIPATGSSGHIGGGMLLAGLLGGEPALLTIAAVLLIQCLFFADGGLLALGANIFNMGVIPCLLIYPFLWKPWIRKRTSKGRLLAISVLASVIGLQLGAFSVVLETLASGITELPFTQFLLLMQPIHLAIGIVEGLITGAILSVVYDLQPELLELRLQTETEGGTSHTRLLGRGVVLLALLALLVGGGLSRYASEYPDGLEWSVAGVTGDTELKRTNPVADAMERIQTKTALLPDYQVAGDSVSEENGTSIAGLVGALVTMLLAGGLGFLLSRSRAGKQRGHMLENG